MQVKQFDWRSIDRSNMKVTEKLDQSSLDSKNQNFYFQLK